MYYIFYRSYLAVLSLVCMCMCMTFSCHYAHSDHLQSSGQSTKSYSSQSTTNPGKSSLSESTNPGKSSLSSEYESSSEENDSGQYITSERGPFNPALSISHQIVIGSGPKPPNQQSHVITMSLSNTCQSMSLCKCLGIIAKEYLS